MRKHFSYLLPMLYVWAGLVISGVVWKLIPREPAVELPPYMPWGSNWHVRHRGAVLVYEITVPVQAENLDAAQVKALQQRVVENFRAQVAVIAELRRGVVVEHEYLDRDRKLIATFVVKTGDCT